MLGVSKAAARVSSMGLSYLPESTMDRYDRLKAEGTWDSFSDRRRQYRVQGRTPRDADILAHRDFMPPWLAEDSS